MIDFLERQVREHGRINASRRWLPACSFLPDTAEALWSALSQPAGLYQVDSNARWSFFDIATALNNIARAAQDAVNAAAGTTTSSSLISIPLERA